MQIESLLEHHRHIHTYMSTAPACFSDGSGPEDLPRCSWEEFAGNIGIVNAAKASEFLNKMAVHYRLSRTDAIPPEVISMAETYYCDPHVMWLWLLCPEFRGEPAGMPMQGDPTDPDKYYLLNVMRQFCTTTSTKSMKELAQEGWEDRRRYLEVQRQIISLELGRPVAGNLGMKYT